MPNNSARHSFRMTVAGEADASSGGADVLLRLANMEAPEDDDDELEQAEVPPARPVRSTSYLGSSRATSGPAATRNTASAQANTSNTTTATTTNIRPQKQQQQQKVTIRHKQQQQQLGNLGNGTNSNSKDLIIRMLAEIFQVRQDPASGQLRWQQVSSSLVPISLYSRTTSRWLDYLLGAACQMQANDPAQTMSPDSRDFLLQLQQFHLHNHQQQQQHLQASRPTSRATNNTLDPRSQRQIATQQQQQQDSIVFQVVGHDFLEGACRKILSVKIRQPGVRLGQASDFFVYWKELGPHQPHHPHLHHQQFSASSFADSSMLSNNNNNHQVPFGGGGSIQMLNPTCRLGPSGAGGPPGQTWGLNFASVNDAKLFYDICSLNLVTLDFNSDYLKQLTAVAVAAAVTTTGASDRQHNLRNSHMLMSSRSNSTQQQQQQQQQQYQRQASSSRISRQGSSSQAAGANQNSHPAASRCPSCRAALVEVERRRRQLGRSPGGSGRRQLAAGQNNNNNSQDVILAAAATCPVHGASQLPVTPRVRARSRSTTRQPESQSQNNNNNNKENLRDAHAPMRARSFSTPASPEPPEEPAALLLPDSACPVHSVKRRRARAHTTSESVASQCGLESAPQRKPEKPARGLLRSSFANESGSLGQSSQAGERTLSGSGGGGGGSGKRRLAANSAPMMPAHQLQQQQHQAVVSSDRALHTKRNTRSRYMGYLHNAISHQHPLNSVSYEAQVEPALQQQEQQLQQQQDLLLMGAHESNRSLFQRLQARPGRAVATSEDNFQQQQQQQRETFDAISRRDARLARARYANSRNMKEFLSLDAGGMQTGGAPVGCAGPAGLQRLQMRSARERGTSAAAAAGGERASSEFATAATGARQSKSIDKSGQVASTSAALAAPRRLPSSARNGNGNGPSATGAAPENPSNSAQGHSAATGATAAAACCNVSTTTEDLPLDGPTKRRMLKLTSEEVISETTEPAPGSAASVSTVLEGRGPRATVATVAGNERARADEARQVRAISLGPVQERGRGARSEAGRRRSLERSTRIVDQQQQQGQGQLMKFAPGLSPLPQAPSPLEPPLAPNGEWRHEQPSPLCPGPHQPEAPVVVPLELDYARHSASGGGQRGQLFTHFARATDLELASSRDQEPGVLLRSASHKSAPDIGRLLAAGAAAGSGISTANDNEAAAAADNFHTSGPVAAGSWAQERQRRRQQQHQAGHFVNTNAGVSTMSSYAVPLCSTVKRPPPAPASQTARQCRSCPSSLRRKRRLQPAPLDSLDSEFAIAAGELGPDFALGQYCSCQQQQQQQRECAPSTSDMHCNLHMCHLLHHHQFGHNPVAASCRMHWHEPPPPHMHTQAMEHHAPHHHQHGAHQCAHVAHVSYGAEAAAAHEASCFHHGRRPASALSARSPTQFGLYESDDDDDSAADLDSDNNSEAAADDHHEQNYHRQHSGRGECHSSAAATQQLRPVPGYDRTLTRAQLRSRQRSKSQPPAAASSEEPLADATSSPATAALHLTKSMENVEKLIREVQSELRALKGRPQPPSGGVAKIDLLCPHTGTGTSHHQAEINRGQREPSAGHAPGASGIQRGGNSSAKASANNNNNNEAKVAQEEQEASAAAATRNNNSQNNQNKLPPGPSLSSATRRAGQFRAAGAIRKAGFLSVKKWILKRRQSIELARKQGWKRYWVCLRGTALLFHSVIDDHPTTCDDSIQHQHRHQQPPASAGGGGADQTDLLSWLQANCSGQQLGALTSLLATSENSPGDQTRNNRKLEDPKHQHHHLSRCFIEREPRHLIIIEGAVAQPIPEHPRRDFVFCLSTTFGDAYLFQASCQLESDNWIAAMHNACAASIARDLGRHEAVKQFETRVRHLELEADKKVFLRQRLESRLTSMSAMCQVAAAGAGPQQAQTTTTTTPADRNKSTLRNLLGQLSQQLLALDTYIEQLHCEAYQLRCYLWSCGSTSAFYSNKSAHRQQQQQPPAGGELPNPKSLLMHASKPTKLLLIKLGVFTVSSFHAYVHARQESASAILETLQQQQQQQQQQQTTGSPVVELRLRSRSISESFATSSARERKLAADTENLLELANLAPVRITLGRELYEKILRGATSGAPCESRPEQPQVVATAAAASGDDPTLEMLGDEFVCLKLEMNSSSTSGDIVRQALRALRTPRCNNNAEHLNYFLRRPAAAGHNSDQTQQQALRRDETLGDLTEALQSPDGGVGDGPPPHLELLEKVVFRVELTRSRLDEGDSAAAAPPFGLAVEGQLVGVSSGDSQAAGGGDSLLSVYASYVEWGSAADKAGLQDEDELLAVNGVRLADLDLMFVECILAEASQLRLVVRSNRCECPPRARLLDPSTWRSMDDDDEDEDDDDQDGHRRKSTGRHFRSVTTFQVDGATAAAATGSQIITDEYLESLVCPPPPARSAAFLRTDTHLLRQKSDLSMDRLDGDSQLSDRGGGLCKSKSQHQIGTARDEHQPPVAATSASCEPAAAAAAKSTQRPPSSADLARQLLQRSERITKLLHGKQQQQVVTESSVSMAHNDDDEEPAARGHIPATAAAVAAQNNVAERLRRSLLELVETEYAYIRHLETISEHYMAPLGESNFLDIGDLRAFNETILALLNFQHNFFGRLMDCIFEECNLDFAHGVHASVARDHFERFNKIVQHVESWPGLEVAPGGGSGGANNNSNNLWPLIGAIARTFAQEADKFRLYAAYCAAYARLQRLLHPRRPGGSSQSKAAKAAAALGGRQPATITSAPLALNVFVASNCSHMSASGSGASGFKGSGGQRDFKLLLLSDRSPSSSGATSGLVAAEEQLRRLADFLASLDSSSSSASFSSLPRSSSPEQQHGGERLRAGNNRKAAPGKAPNSAGPGAPPTAQAANEQQTGSTSAPTSAAYQKSGVHQQNFESYLIKPIQRIVKYPMLLSSISLTASAVASASCSAQQQQPRAHQKPEVGIQITRAAAPAPATPENPHLDDLQLAIRQMETVINHVNDAQRVHDEYAALFAHIERQFFETLGGGGLEAPPSLHFTSGRTSSATYASLFGPHQPPIALGMGQLLHFGPVHWLNLNEFTSRAKKSMQLASVLFVFESCVVLVCKEQLSGAGSSSSGTGRSSRVLPWASTGSAAAVSASGNGFAQTGSGDGQPTGSAVVRYQTLIPVSEVQVRSVADDSSNSKSQAADSSQQQWPHRWQLFQCSSSNSNSGLLTSAAKGPAASSASAAAAAAAAGTTKQQQHQNQGHSSAGGGKVYLLASATNEERSACLRKIRMTIRDSVRNMSLPPLTGTSKSPASQKSPATTEGPCAGAGVGVQTNKLSSSSGGSSVSSIAASTAGGGRGDPKGAKLTPTRDEENTTQDADSSATSSLSTRAGIMQRPPGHGQSRTSSIEIQT